MHCACLTCRQVVKPKRSCLCVRDLYDMSDFLFIPLQVCPSDLSTYLTNHISESGNAVVSVCLSVRPFVYFLSSIDVSLTFTFCV